MNSYSLQITTVPGSADSAFLDRLADIAYEIVGLRNLQMGLNPDASIAAMFDLDAADPLAAADRGVQLFSDAVALAEPLPYAGESPVESFSVSSLTGRDLATA